ncbi:MAG: methenyltetrahydromethanopterin cyclohydrolase [Anaerolineaceae bacterium]|nr:methenyltetrahydromethanopterin cyclohydrolase [Anaerolineaceae bacterium]
MISINREAMKLVREILESPAVFDVQVSQLQNGATVIDMGQKAMGTWLAAKYYTLISMGGIGQVSYEGFMLDHVSLPAVRVMIDYPIETCVASQIAGWRLESGEDSVIVAGPARALNKKNPDHFMKIVPYRDENNEGVIALQTARPISEGIAAQIAESCGLAPQNLYILVAANSSLVCAVQVSARVIDILLHRLAVADFDINISRFGQGYCVIPPLINDQHISFGRINDAIVYGSVAMLYVEGDDEEIENIVKQIPSSVSPVYGRPFLEIYEDAGRDFYNIPMNLNSPAVVHINNLNSGNTFSAGEINYDVLSHSFFGKPSSKK